MTARPRVRQLGLGELLDETFRIYRGSFITFVAIAALVYVPYALLNLLLALPLNRQLQSLSTMTTSTGTPDDLGFLFDMLGGLVFWSLGAVALGLLYTIVFQPLLQGALTRSVAQLYLGRPMEVGDSFGTALRRAWPLIGSRLLTAVLGASLLIVGMVVYFGAIFAFIGMMAQSDGGQPAIGGLIAVGLLSFAIIVAGGILFLFVWTRLLFTPQAAVVEQHGAWSSVQRSWELTRGFFWRTLGFLLVIGLLAWLVTIIPSAVFTIPAAILLPENLTLQSMISTVAGTVVTVIVTPFSAIAWTLMYYDLRVRKEAFDLEQRADQLLPPAPGYGLPGAS